MVCRVPQSLSHYVIYWTGLQAHLPAGVVSNVKMHVEENVRTHLRRRPKRGQLSAGVPPLSRVYDLCSIRAFQTADDDALAIGACLGVKNIGKLRTGQIRAQTI